MLFKVKTLRQIKEGKVTLAFRKWKTTTVKTGGNLVTPAGQLKIDQLGIINSIEAITDSDADRTGFSKEELIETLKDRDGDLYRIDFHLSGEDPRIQLRENLITEVEIDLILKKLKRMDNASSYGAWTNKVLALNDKTRMFQQKSLLQC